MSAHLQLLYHLILHLPSEAQWEKAARGEYGNGWPWGNEFDCRLCDLRGSRDNNTVEKDYFPINPEKIRACP